MPIGLRPSVPLKITSAISPPRSALADCSPKTQRIASETLDLPHPLGPTMAATPGWKFRDVLSANDLKPNIVRFLRYMTVPTNSVLLVRVKPKPTTSCGKLFTRPQTNSRNQSDEPDFRREKKRNCSKKLEKCEFLAPAVISARDS